MVVSSFTTSMEWSECTFEGGSPTIKNHSVTYYNNFLYCFGGYDGRRNHMTLILYDLQESRWIRPQHEHDSESNNNNSSSSCFLKDETSTIVVQGTPPPGRNGHSATLAQEDGGSSARIIIIGGWLGMGPLAASDMHILDISSRGKHLRWYQPQIRGEAPGPCNMHSADYVKSNSEVYVFRGGNGREYLNDLHALHVDTLTWRRVETVGAIPQQRANHSSAIMEETNELFIFGGWNGTERLNDIHILDIATSTWTFPKVGGVKPFPRAGMTLTSLRGRLFLFGGSGTSAKCFQDLQIYDRQEMAWLDVSQYDGKRGISCYNDAATWERTPNPNDEDAVPSVLIHGSGPRRRAGHTATAVHSNIFIFGGSCGSDYLNDFFVLDTDPAPQAVVSEPTSVQQLERRLRHFFNDEEFADVVFLVQGQRVYGHKMILSIVSDCFRAMFTTGFRESDASEIEIPDCTYRGFLCVMEYMYTGVIPSNANTELLVELLELADRFFLDHLKQTCESRLHPDAASAEYLLSIAHKTNANQLLAVCEHYLRNRDQPPTPGMQQQQHHQHR